jgi:preprotein translocase subunit SecE
MAKDTSDTFISNLFSGALFKPTQGQMVRRITGIVLGLIIIVGCYVMSRTVLMNKSDALQIGLPCVLGAIGLWAVFRLIHFPRFANFLVQVEGEMAKVSWADQAYLVRATSVVIGTMLVLGAFLLICDAVWVQFFDFIGFLDMDALNASQ